MFLKSDSTHSILLSLCVSDVLERRIRVDDLQRGGDDERSNYCTRDFLLPLDPFFFLFLFVVSRFFHGHLFPAYLLRAGAGSDHVVSGE